ncbi:MAG TPA: C4-dicarboxylate ABC transporter substrate-binding protein, partial [Aestuariivirgaceae bacterium]|nr:C4-dicarboxylate ABC transporter substrate-binding protein [Aestuariivirgaceae bacterium]
MCIPSCCVAGLALVLAIVSLPAAAQVPAATPKPKPVAKVPARQPVLTDQQHKDRINSWTVGLAAGRIEGAPLLFASELARVLDDGDNMRVLPIVTRGPFDNVYDLLYLRGVDAAIVYGDVLDHFKNKSEFANSWRRINYLLNLFPSEAHVFARPEIKSMQDLAGKVVNFNTAGTAANFSGPIVFKQLGIDVKATFIPHSVAMEKMRQSDEIAATFWISSKPLPQFLKGKWPEGFRFLPIEYTEKLEYYVPAQLEHGDYPNLIAEGQQISTISV